MEFKLLVVAFALSFAHLAAADTDFSQTTFRTLDQNEAALFLGTPDEYTSQLNDLNRAIRRGDSEIVTSEAYHQWLSKQARSFTAGETAVLAAAVRMLEEKVKALHLTLPLPREVLIIRSTGKEDFGAAYTRGNAIVFPPGKFSFKGATPAEIEHAASRLFGLFCHELFHVLSRASRDFQDASFNVIHFRRIPEVIFPESFAAQMVVNPDAFRYDHILDIEGESGTLHVFPVLYTELPLSEAEDFDLNTAMTAPLMSLAPAANGTFEALLNGEGKPVLFRINPAFYAKVGRNTYYTIHPEEIMADNFKLLLMGRPGTNPEIIEALRTAISQ